MGKKLAEGVNVHLADAAGEVHTFLEGSEVPDWAMAKLGPHCFAEDYDPDVDGPPVAPDAAAAAEARDKAQKAIAEANQTIAASLAPAQSDVPPVSPPEGQEAAAAAAAAEPAAGEGETGTPPADPQASAGDPPPLGGTGSDRDSWAAYATALGLDPADKNRDEIVALVQSSGYKTAADAS